MSGFLYKYTRRPFFHFSSVSLLIFFHWPKWPIDIMSNRAITRPLSRGCSFVNHSSNSMVFKTRQTVTIHSMHYTAHIVKYRVGPPIVEALSAPLFNSHRQQQETWAQPHRGVTYERPKR